uniref:Large ribosomal subunit protein bL21m n=1 Tax=Mesocestoides corti TaxID=53468 RepID=A0A5K3G231_MESCO
DVRSKVSESLARNESRYFAVVHFAAPLLEAAPGEIIRLEKVLLAGNTDFTIVGRPLIPRNNVFVTAMVVEKTLQHPALWYQFHRRRRHRAMRVFQDNSVTLRIVDVFVKDI